MCADSRAAAPSQCPPEHLHAQIQAVDMDRRLHACFCAGHNSCYRLSTSCVAALYTSLPQEVEQELIFCANILLEKENPGVRGCCISSFASRSLAELPPPTPLPVGSQQTQFLHHTQGARGRGWPQHHHLAAGSLLGAAALPAL